MVAHTEGYGAIWRGGVMAWPAIDWDAVNTYEMADGIASLYTAYNERRNTFLDFSAIQQPLGDWVLANQGRRYFIKEDSTESILPADADAIQPFNNPLVDDGGYINFNLYQFNNHIIDTWAPFTGAGIFDFVIDSNTVYPGYTYQFIEEIGGDLWTRASITSALSLPSDFFDTKAMEDVDIMDATVWSDYKKLLDALVFVRQRRLNFPPPSIFIQDIDLRPYLTDQT